MVLVCCEYGVSMNQFHRTPKQTHSSTEQHSMGWRNGGEDSTGQLHMFPRHQEQGVEAPQPGYQLLRVLQGRFVSKCTRHVRDDRILSREQTACAVTYGMCVQDVLQQDVRRYSRNVQM